MAAVVLDATVVVGAVVVGASVDAPGRERRETSLVDVPHSTYPLDIQFTIGDCMCTFAMLYVYIYI